jgi:dolichol-phosphate mannosyltransferase
MSLETTDSTGHFDDSEISIVLPVFNESAGIQGLLKELERVLSRRQKLFVIVDDGSSDDTVERLLSYKLEATSKLYLVRLSRNFGHAAAIMAGLHAVPNDISTTVVMDADFQDRPEDLLDLLNELERQQVDCAYAVRPPNADNQLINYSTRLFYGLLRRISLIDIPPYAGNFSVFNRRFREQILNFRELDIYFPGIRAYIGMRQIAVQVQRAPRRFGRSRFGLLRLVGLASSGIMGFSVFLPRLMLILGFLITAFCGFLGISVIILKVVGVIDVIGYASLVLLILGVSGFQIVLLGVIGEYLGKVFIQSKGRPRWIVQEDFIV